LEIGGRYARGRRFASLAPDRAPTLGRPYAFTASLHLAPRAVHGQSYANSGILRRGMMSALGQKQTYAVQHDMSALLPIATSIAFFGMSALGQKRTFLRCDSDVHFMPKADIDGRKCDVRY
jgi:hypothetical protein